MAGPPAQVPPKDYFIGFNYAVDRQSINNLLALIQQAVNLKAKSVTICISSNGGAPDQALYAYEIIQALHIPIHTHAIGCVQSAAMILFISGDKRTAAPGTNFLFHDTVFNGGAMPLRYDDLIGRAQGIEHNDKWSHQLIADELDLSAEEVAKWFTGQNIRDTAFALEKGIIKEIVPLIVPPDAEFVQVGYKF